MKSNFSKNLKYLRKKNNLSQNKLAKKLNINQTTIARWEDENREPTISNALDVARYFNITVDRLLDADLMLEEEKNKNSVKSGLNFSFNKRLKDILEKNNTEATAKNVSLLLNIPIERASQLLNSCEPTLEEVVRIGKIFLCDIEYVIGESNYEDEIDYLFVKGNRKKEKREEVNEIIKLFKEVTKYTGKIDEKKLVDVLTKNGLYDETKVTTKKGFDKIKKFIKANKDYMKYIYQKNK